MRAIQRSRIRGATLVESMVALFITVLIVTAMAAGLRTMAIGASQQVTDSGMGFDARRGVDEMLSHMRYGAAVVPSFTSGTKTYTTSGSTVVMSAMGYDGTKPEIILATVTDYLIFEYDATRKEIRETIIPGLGSKRVARTNYRLARNVSGLTFTYRVRQQLIQNTATKVHTLIPSATSAPSVIVGGVPLTVDGVPVTVGGVPSSGLWVASKPAELSVTATINSDVQAFYPVSASDATALQHVQQVDAKIDLSDTDAKSNTRTLTMSGIACLRNRRI
jgi:hypothetical protein